MMGEVIGMDAVINKLAEVTIVKGNATQMPFDNNEFDIGIRLKSLNKTL